jgi:hypothetical protein
VLHRVSSLRGNGAAVLSNKDCCEGSCVRKGLLGSGLRRGDLHHVACWIRSSSSGDILRVIGRFLSGGLTVKDRDKTHRITGVILYQLSLVKQRYPHYQKLEYTIYMTGKKLPHYFECHSIVVVASSPLASILNNPDATGPVSLWGITLGPWDITYQR